MTLCKIPKIFLPLLCQEFDLNQVLLAFFDFFIVLLFALAAVLLKAIDSRGFIASVAVGFSILYGGGWNWFAIVAAFFTLGVGFTWYKYSYKRKIGAAQEKGGARNWPNILANGGLAAVFSMLELVYGGSIFAFLFLGSIATATSDTVATEIGLLSKSRPRLITKPSMRVNPGYSGGVTAYGIMGSFISALIIGILASFLGVGGDKIIVILCSVSSGVLGSLFDSFLGASLQRKSYCRICLKPTEHLKHCGENTIRTSGLFFMDNNVVNLISTLFGSLISYFFFLL
jgi:uncharacterized protein (TIGR00297 family)